MAGGVTWSKCGNAKSRRSISSKLASSRAAAASLTQAATCAPSRRGRVLPTMIPILGMSGVLSGEGAGGSVRPVAGQRGVVEVADLVGSLGEAPAIGRAPVAVVVDRI